MGKSAALLVILIFLAASLAIARPASIVGFSSAQTPAQSIETTAFVGVEPNPAEIGQLITLSMLIEPPPPTPADCFNGLTVTMTRPDGTTHIIGPFLTTISGSQYTYYTPVQSGNYTIQLKFPGQSFANGTITYKNATSQITTLNVKAKDGTPETVPSASLAPTSPVSTNENYWVTKASMHEARGNLGVVVVNGKIYTVGGRSNRGVIGTNEEYDPTVDRWKTLAPMPTPRADFGIAVYQNKIYCMGGSAYPYTSVNEVYDPATNAWEIRAAMPRPMDLLSANVVNGKVFVVSGYFDWGANMASNVNMAYDPATDSWEMKTSPPHRITSALTVVDNMVYYLGYRLTNSQESPTEDIVQVYDAENDRWSVRGSAPGRLYGAAGVTSGVDAPKRIYVFDATATRIYNPANNSWAIGTPLPTARASAEAAVIDDNFYVVGGGLTTETFPLWTTTYYATNEKYTPFLFGTVPTVSIISPKNMTYASVDAPLNFTVSETTSWTGYSLDELPNVTLTGNDNLTGLPEGTHSLVVYARNFAGDVTSFGKVYFTVDVSPPSILVLSPENKTYSSTSVALNFAVDEPTSWVHYSLDAQNAVAIEGNITLTGLLVGSHNITVYAADAAGNTGFSEPIIFRITEAASFPTMLVAAGFVAVALVGAGLLLHRRIRHREAA